MNDPNDKPALRDTQVLFYMTQEDAQYLEEAAADFGFKSRSRLMTSIMERVVRGGFSGVTWAKLAWHFVKLIDAHDKLKRGQKNFRFQEQPEPPKIGTNDEPTRAEIIDFLPYLERQTRKDKSA